MIHKRLVLLLPNLISIEHAYCIKDTSIVVNVLVTQEIIIDIRLRTMVGPNIVIKLDMTRSYDRLSWVFLSNVLRKLGFSERFIGVLFGMLNSN